MDLTHLLAEVGLPAHSSLEDPRLTTRDFDLGPTSQLNVQTSTDPRLDTINEAEVDDLLSVGAKELARIETGFEIHQRPIQQRLVRSPAEPDVISFGLDQQDLAQRHEPASGAISHEQLIEWGVCRRT